MPESMSLERRSLLKAYGAQIVLTPDDLTMEGAVEEARRLCKQADHVMLMQFENPANPQKHRDSTGPELLEQMRRGYSRQQFLDLVGALREAVPSIALSTDIMVGFCGETDRDHQQTLEVMREVRFDFAFMFSYSDRGITYASRKMTDDVPAEVKGARLRDVIDLQETHTRASHDAWVGKSLDVLVLGPSKRGDKTLGRAPTFHKVLLPPDAGARGSFVRARITGSTGHSLLADLG